MVSDVVLERFFTDNVFAVAAVGKRQKCSVTAAFIRNTFSAASFYISSPLRLTERLLCTATHSSGVIAWALPAFVSVET